MVFQENEGGLKLMLCGKCGNDNGITDWEYNTTVCICKHCGFVLLSAFVQFDIKDEKIQRDITNIEPTQVSPHSSIE